MIKGRTVLSSLTVVLVPAFASVCSSQPRYDHKVEQWGLEEIVLQSSQHYKNPFREVTLSASFECTGERQTVTGFYDGESTWKVRFMPQRLGHCGFQTTSNDSEISLQSGSFDVTSPTIGNHGPVHVAKTYHFSYSDGTPYFLLGTTLYNWLNRDEALQRETLDTLGHSSFTKVRFGLFPKWFIFNHEEPTIYPYVETSPGSFDLDQFNPRFFQSVERRIAELEKMGIEADLILFHPYDHLGFARVDADHDDAYIRYVAARLHGVEVKASNSFDVDHATTISAWAFYEVLSEAGRHAKLRSEASGWAAGRKLLDLASAHEARMAPNSVSSGHPSGLRAHMFACDGNNMHHGCLRLMSPRTDS